MIHGVKKAVTATSKPRNAQYSENKVKIESIEKMLKRVIKEQKEVEKTYETLARHHFKFYERFFASLEVHEVAQEQNLKQLAQRAQQAGVKINEDAQRALHAGQTKECASNTGYHINRNRVEAYVAEIDALKKEYSKLTDAQTEVDMYQRKVKDLEDPKRSVEKEKIDRNRSKLTERKNEFETMLEQILVKQRSILEKWNGMYRESMASYWLMHGVYLESLQKPLYELEAQAVQQSHDVYSKDVKDMM